MCRACGTGRENSRTAAGWQTTYHLPDGSSRVLLKRPLCVPGPRTPAVLRKYADAL